MECNEEYKNECNSKFEESKPQDDKRSLLSTLKMLKSTKEMPKDNIFDHIKINKVFICNK